MIKNKRWFIQASYDHQKQYWQEQQYGTRRFEYWGHERPVHCMPFQIQDEPNSPEFWLYGKRHTFSRTRDARRRWKELVPGFYVADRHAGKVRPK